MTPCPSTEIFTFLYPETTNMLYYKERRRKDVDEIKTLR